MFSGCSRRWLHSKSSSIHEAPSSPRFISNTVRRFNQNAADAPFQQSKASANPKPQAKRVLIRKHKTYGANETIDTWARLPGDSPWLHTISQPSPGKMNRNSRTAATTEDYPTKQEDPKPMVFRNRSPIASITPQRAVVGIEIARTWQNLSSSSKEGHVMTENSPNPIVNSAARALAVAETIRQKFSPLPRVSKHQAPPAYPDPEMERLTGSPAPEKRRSSRPRIRKEKVRSLAYRRMLRSRLLVRRYHLERSRFAAAVRRVSAPRSVLKPADRRLLSGRRELQRHFRDVKLDEIAAETPKLEPPSLKGALNHGSRTLRALRRRRLKNSMKIRRTEILTIRKLDERQIRHRMRIEYSEGWTVGTPLKIRRLKTTPSQIQVRKHISKDLTPLEGDFIRKYSARSPSTRDERSAPGASSELLDNLDDVLKAYEAEPLVDPRFQARELHSRSKR